MDTGESSDKDRSAQRAGKDPLSLRNRTVLVSVLICGIVIAHVFLWLSDMALGLKVTFTLLNAVGWAIVLVPMLFVDRWLDSIRRRNQDR